MANNGTDGRSNTRPGDKLVELSVARPLVCPHHKRVLRVQIREIGPPVISDNRDSLAARALDPRASWDYRAARIFKYDFGIMHICRHSEIDNNAAARFRVNQRFGLSYLRVERQRVWID